MFIGKNVLPQSLRESSLLISLYVLLSSFVLFLLSVIVFLVTIYVVVSILLFVYACITLCVLAYIMSHKHDLKPL